MYCGAAFKDTASEESLDLFKKEQKTTFSRQVGKDETVCEVIQERKYNTDDVSEDWQKKIAEAIQRSGADISTDFSFQGQDIFSLLSHVKTPRRARLHPLILALIFFASAALVGMVLWLLG
jgi:hypothetical protein